MKFAIVFVAVNLHVLRNISLPGYMMFYAPIALFVSFQFAFMLARKPREIRIGPFFVWLAIAAGGTLTSVAVISLGGALTGLSRFLFGIPVFFALYLYTDGIADLRKHILTFGVFFAVAAMTIPLQTVTGPISWFAVASTRAGLDRYASLLGSLTSIGTVVGAYVVLAQALSPGRRWALLLLMALPAAMSLNKSAIANIAIAVLILIYLNRATLSKLAVGVLTAGMLAGAAYGTISTFASRIDAVLVSFGINREGIVNYDTKFDDSLWDRLYSLPLANFEVLGQLGSPFVYLTGGGFGMASTALVPADDALAPMAHNQFAELLTVFGAIGASLACGALAVVGYRLYRLYKATKSDVVSAVGFSLLVLLVNSLFANGTFYQPAASSIIFLAMFVSGFSAKSLDSEQLLGMADPTDFGRSHSRSLE